MRILYRGPLASCNYDCPYCPFAKRRDSPEQLRADRAALERFVAWVEANPDGYGQIGVLFTPWGEGLSRPWYRSAMTRLSHVEHVERVAIQTNLACRLGWLDRVDPARLALWATYHPGEVAEAAFLARCHALTGKGIRYSVGVVGLPAHLDAARRMRTLLPQSVYLWVNAAEGHPYTVEEESRWTELDPLFSYSVRPHESRGHECRAGENVISVDGDGTVRRCHFVPTPLGNLYDGSYRRSLAPRGCENAFCDCHIGYVHLKRLPLYEIFDGGVLERIPNAPLWRSTSWGVPQVWTSG